MSPLEIILMALGLSADSLAVSLCSSVTLRKVDWKSVATVASAFAFIQAGLLFGGWGFGELLQGIVGKAARLLSFLLLLYVAASMLYEGIVWKGEVRNLDSFRNIVIGGIATSIDAAVAGAAETIDGMTLDGLVPLMAAVFIITAVSVVAGILSGAGMGRRYGRAAEVAGGIVLLSIAFWNLLR